MVVFVQACGGSGPPPNNPPTATFTATPATGPPPLAVSFDASGSSDDDGSIRTHAWDFGNGSTASGRTVDHTYEGSGAFEVVLIVTDDDGSRASANEELVVNLPPTARISADPVDGEAPITVTFDSAESADSDGEIVSYQWVVANGAPTDGAMIEHTFDEPGVYLVELTVTDELGGMAQAVIEMNVRTMPAWPTRFPTLPMDPMPTISGAARTAETPCRRPAPWEGCRSSARSSTSPPSTTSCHACWSPTAGWATASRNGFTNSLWTFVCWRARSPPSSSPATSARPTTRRTPAQSTWRPTSCGRRRRSTRSSRRRRTIAVVSGPRCS